MKFLFLGDIVGSPGRRVLRRFVPELRAKEGLDLIIANGENAAAGKGMDEKCLREVFEAGVDVITGGNHSWAKKEAFDLIKNEPCFLRPANYPALDIPGVECAPGRGHVVVQLRGLKLAVINLLGRVHMEPVLDCPFECAHRIVSMLQSEGIQHIVVDMHAEATSEKQAMAHFLAGRVSAVLGSHTHVQTADERILRNSGRDTAYITDAGMTGPYDSVVGMTKERSLARFLSKLPQRYEAAEHQAGLHGVVVELDDLTGSARTIRRVSLFEPSL